MAHQEQLPDLHRDGTGGEAGDSQPQAARRASEARQFLAAAIEYIPPKGQQTVRYYGLYYNKRRGLDAKAKSRRPEAPLLPPPPPRPPATLLPPLPPQSARALRPLWRELIRLTWSADPMVCPCCGRVMKKVGKVIRREEIEFFLRLFGLWEGVIALPPPPDPPYDIEKRRGIGGVLDGGEAGARRVSPPGGAGESNHRAD